MRDNNENSGYYINPTSIPTTVVRIQRSDPRNNIMFLAENPNVIVVDDNQLETGLDAPVVENLQSFASENADPQSLYLTQNNTSNITSIFLDNQADSIISNLNAPDGLAIDSSSFRIENDNSTNSDGRITMVVSLNFNEVPGATGYEYQIDAV